LGALPVNGDPALGGELAFQKRTVEA
jgi:hypothetical protein